MLSKLSWAFVAALVAAAPALAATPVVSGKYIFSSRSICQPTLTASTSGSSDGDIHSLNFFFDENHPGDEHYVTGVGTADPVGGTLTFNAFQVGGTVLLLQSGSTQGSGDNDVPLSGTVPFSNTATTFTFNGTTFHAFYGQVKKRTGIAGMVALVGLQTSTPSCIQQLEMTRISN